MTPSLWSFVAQSNWIVKIVLLILCLSSVFSWSIILEKTRQLRLKRRQMKRFGDDFLRNLDMRSYFNSLHNHKQAPSGLARLFYTAYHCFLEFQHRGQIDPEYFTQTLQRRVAQDRRQILENLESRHSWLATIGSICPYIGLFGTVWGIMSAFRALGVAQQASIAMVAPGIAEALIATAIGLFAAIPAVIAYNRIAQAIRQIDENMLAFEDKLTDLLLKQAHQPKTAQSVQES